MCGEAPGPLMPRGHKERSERAGVLGAWPTPEAQVLSWASCVQQASSCRATFLRGGGWGTNVQGHGHSPPLGADRPSQPAQDSRCTWGPCITIGAPLSCRSILVAREGIGALRHPPRFPGPREEALVMERRPV